MRTYDILNAGPNNRFMANGRIVSNSGNILQPQNLPQNHLPDLDFARDVVKDGDFEALQMLFGNVPNVLSELIRTVLVPKDGCRFIVADFSAIEARVLSWLAGEEWRLDTFRNGGDIYCAAASQMFGVPVEKHGQNAELRQKGKISELACGYGGGVGALISMGALDMGISEDELESLIYDWRDANISPLLSNIMLNELDKELEARGLHYTRYADDCVIAVRSRASATRVMHTITKWIEKKLGLKVNAEKTHITRPSNLKYLGFGFWKSKDGWKARPHQDSVKRFKAKLKELCKRNWSIDLTYRIKKLNEVIRGWINYYIIGSMKNALTRIDEHLRTMIRVIIWKQWKVPKKREWGLRKLGINKDLARLTSYCGNRYQWIVTKTCVVRAISKEKLTKRGLVSYLDYYTERRRSLGLS